MILDDIRVQLVLALLSVPFFVVWFIPDRVMRTSGMHSGSEADARIMLRIFAGALPFAFMAALPSFYHQIFTPLPSGPAAVGNVWVWLADLKARSSAFGLVLLSVYAVVGFAWSIAHFWLYARRLGQLYVMERDSWLRARNRTNLDGLSQDERKDFETVLAKVKAAMLYDGEFPLQPLQQKRFFIANAVLWPATLAWYLFADMALDAARYIWFSLRGWIRRQWEAGMTQYLEDDALCRALMAEMEIKASAT